jgi:hypothetical protein
MYGDVKEVVPIDAPAPLGNEVYLRLYADSDHAKENFSWHSRKAFVIFLNMARIVWFSKQQPTVESSVFGVDFVTMKNGIETFYGVRYKFLLMGVPLSAPR